MCACSHNNVGSLINNFYAAKSCLRPSKAVPKAKNVFQF